MRVMLQAFATVFLVAFLANANSDGRGLFKPSSAQRFKCATRRI
jgi:hypothetical protein